MYIFCFAKQPKMYSLLLCSLPFKFPRRVVFKANIPKWMWLFNGMSPLCLKYFFSGCNFKLQGHLFELSPLSPQYLYKSSDFVLRSGRRYIILDESNYNLFEFIPKPIYLVFWSRSKPREGSLVLKRNVLIALGIVLPARFGHLKHVNKCHWLKQLEHFFPHFS